MAKPLSWARMFSWLKSRSRFSLKDLAVASLPLGVVFAVEGPPYVRLRRFDQPPHVPLELHCLAGPQLQRSGPVGIVEVVDVAPIGRRLLVPGRPLEKGGDGGHLASARQAGGVDVEAGVLYLQPELESLERPVLPDYGLGRFELLRALKTQAARVTDPAHLFGVELPGHSRPFRIRECQRRRAGAILPQAPAGHDPIGAARRPDCGLSTSKRLCYHVTGTVRRFEDRLCADREVLRQGTSPPIPGLCCAPKRRHSPGALGWSIDRQGSRLHFSYQLPAGDTHGFTGRR